MTNYNYKDNLFSASKLKQLEAEFHEKREGLKKFLLKEVEPGARKLFQQFAELQSFSWTNTTEYNDEEDAFHVNAGLGYGLSVNDWEDDEDFLFINKTVYESEYNSHNKYVGCNEKKNPNYDKAAAEMCRAVEDLFNYSKVTISRNGLEIEEYGSEDD